jgi:hypothetical protein
MDKTKSYIGIFPPFGHQYILFNFMTSFYQEYGVFTKVYLLKISAGRVESGSAIQSYRFGTPLRGLLNNLEIHFRILRKNPDSNTTIEKANIKINIS